MKKFRLPRKTKKKIEKGFYFYPMDPERRTYLVAFPRENQEDYDAWRSGILTNLKDGLKRGAYRK
jgi:hypothetical protein